MVGGLVGCVCGRLVGWMVGGCVVGGLVVWAGDWLVSYVFNNVFIYCNQGPRHTQNLNKRNKTELRDPAVSVKGREQMERRDGRE